MSLLVGALTSPAFAQEAPPAAPSSVFSQLLPLQFDKVIDEPIDPVGRSCCSHLNVIRESLFGKADPDAWRPLTFSNFGEGWNEAWVPSPSGSGGAPRQGWINSSDGNIYRLWFFTFSENFNRSGGNTYLGAYTLYAPLSRRLELIVNVPFAVAGNVTGGLPVITPTGQTTTTSTHGQTSFGDMSFTPRVLLHETQDFTLTAELAVVTPTGSAPLQGKCDLIPAVAFWNNIRDGWVIRGGVGLDCPIEGGSGSTLITQLAIGQTLTGHDVRLIGDFTYYVAAVGNTNLTDGSQTRVTLTPGIRTHLGNDWYFLAGMPIPVTQSRVSDLGLIAWFMKAW
jgi:hypothetical protein